MKNTIILAMLCIQMIAIAQKNYTFIDDRKFKDVSDLIGYTFVPNEVEQKDKFKKLIRPGEFSFTIKKDKLHITGTNISGQYIYSDINTTDYGFIVNLIDLKNPLMHGALKIILNDKKEADILTFRKNQNDPELLYYLAEMSKDNFVKEKKYFTDKNETILPTFDSLDRVKIYPFLVIDEERGIQEKRKIKDSTYFEFIKVTNIEDKTSKKYKIVKRKVDSADITLIIVDTIFPPKKLKITYQYFVKVRWQSLTNGIFESVNKVVEIEKFNETKAIDKNQKEDTRLVDYKLKDGDSIQLYLNENRAFSYLVYNGKKMLARGF
jgi:hypothetical protein